jgi:hypothetical protein
MSSYVKVKTTDHQVVLLRKDSVAGIEPVPASARAPEHLRVYAAGFKWLVDETVESFMNKMGLPAFQAEDESK